jgi:hypothetical protein
MRFVGGSCLLTVGVLFLLPALAVGDGGTIRLAEQKGGYRMTVFTAPTPVRAGAVDISVLVQDAATQEPVANVEVIIKVNRRGSAVVVSQHATSEAATNKLYRAAIFDLPEPGWYAMEVSVAGMLGESQVHFDLEAGPPLPPWLAAWPWLGWPVLVIVLFGIHQFLVRRRSR